MKKYLLLLVLFTGIFAWSCKDEDPVSLTVSPSTLELTTSAATTGTLSVTSVNASWQATYTADWITLDQRFGNSSTEIIVSAKENKDITERTTTITFSAAGVESQTVTVKQPAAVYNITATPADLGFAAEPATGQTLTVTADMEWTSTVKDDNGAIVTWCTLSATTGAKGTTTVTVNAEQNEDLSPRTAVITFAVNGKDAKVNVTQMGEAAAIILSHDDLQLPKEEHAEVVTVVTNLGEPSPVITPESAKDWLSITKQPMSQQSMVSYKYKVIAQKNTTVDDREATITFTSGSLTKEMTVTQVAQDILFVVSPTSLKPFGIQGGKDTITVKTNIETSYTVDTWVEVTRLTDIQKDDTIIRKYALNVLANGNTTTPRSTNLVITPAKGANPVTIAIQQQADPDRAKLLAIRNKLTSPWPASAWTDDKPTSEFEGVTLDGNGNVIGLDLGYTTNNKVAVAGVIATEMKQLTMLKSLKIRATNVKPATYVFGEEFKTLVNLEELALVSNLKIGYAMQSPFEPSVNCTHWDLQACPFSTFTKLRTLHLEKIAFVKANDDGTGNAPMEDIFALNNLESVSFNSVRPMNTGGTLVTNVVGYTLPVIKSNVKKVYFTDCVALKGLNANQTTSSLEELCFEWKTADGGAAALVLMDAANLPKAVFTPSLTKLVVAGSSNMKVTSTNFNYSIPTDISNAPNLRVLRLEWLKALTGKLPTQLGSLTKLDTLSISGCAKPTATADDRSGINGAIPDLSGLASLTYLNLQWNKLSGTVPALPASLKYLSLANNEFTGQIPTFTANTNLEYLSLVGNNNSTTEVPSTTAPMNTYWTGESPSFAHLTKLTDLYLDNNMLTGSVPDMRAATGLRMFYATYNNFTTIPDMYANVLSTAYFNFQYNTLTCQTPPPTALAKGGSFVTYIAGGSYNGTAYTAGTKIKKNSVTNEFYGADCD